MSQQLKTLTVDDDFYSEWDVATISDLVLEFLQAKGIEPSSISFCIKVDYTEEVLG